MPTSRLQAEIIVLNALIKTLDDMYDAGLGMHASFTDLDAIYIKTQKLKLARKALTKRSSDAKKNFNAIPHLMKMAKVGLLN